MPLDQPDETGVVTHTRKNGEGALPTNILSKIRDFGIGHAWTVQVQEYDAGGRTSVQINFYLPQMPAV